MKTTLYSLGRAAAPLRLYISRTRRHTGSITSSRFIATTSSYPASTPLSLNSTRTTTTNNNGNNSAAAAPFSSRRPFTSTMAPQDPSSSTAGPHQPAAEAAPEKEQATTEEPQDPSQPPKEPLALPWSGDGDEVKKLDMSSGEGSMSLDHLGPLVVHKDGTVSRISNWTEMSEIERKNTLRILVKRNQIRIKDLKEGLTPASSSEAPAAVEEKP